MLSSTLKKKNYWQSRYMIVVDTIVDITNRVRGGLILQKTSVESADCRFGSYFILLSKIKAPV